MKCPVCGTANDNTATFCYNCGSGLQPTDREPRPATGATVDLSRTGAHPASSPASSPYSSPTRAQELAGRPPGLPLHGVDRPDHGARIYDTAAQTPAPISQRPVYHVPGSMMPGPYGMAPVTQTSNLAIVSLVLGILGWSMIPLLASFGAVVTGHIARREIQQSGGRLSGEGLAIAGLVLGYLAIGLTVLVAAGFCLFIFGLGSLGG